MNRLLTLVAAVAALSTVLGASVAEAQVEPRVLIVFDTSGSMLWDTAPSPSNATNGDGSADRPGVDTDGNGNADDSRLYIAKQAVRTIVQNYTDVEFGLMRFHQEEGLNILPPEEDDVVGAAFSRYTQPINYSGWFSCQEGSGGGDLLVEVGGSSNDLLEWMDGVESWPNNKELRGTGWTPLALTLQDAASYFADDVIRSDGQRDCRSYYVIMLTDGVRQCPAETPFRSAEAAAAQLRSLGVNGDSFDVKTFVIGFGPGVEGAGELNAIARAGGTAVNGNGAIDLVQGQALFAGDRDALDQALEDVLVAISPDEVCDGRDNDCDGDVDEDFAGLGDSCSDGVGECRRTGEVVCSDSGTRAICNVTEGPRGTEICDGLDNDCDGDEDEGLFNACGTCGATPTEVCDNNDNDCDGEVDEGLRNACGSCGALPTEVCNGVDDDCDGQFDEGLLNACGSCGALPVEECDGGDNDCDDLIDEGFDTMCGECTPTGPEICDGADNDCDARIDEGVRNACNGCGDVPRETCDGRDNDCDGETDEGLLNACGTCDALPEEVCDGEDQDCDGEIDEGAYNACGWCGAVNEESCDNIDNDCDGQIDEGDDLCQSGEACVNGECADPCQDGECFGGTVCRDGWCVTPCDAYDCEQGEVCIDGVCADPCDGITCPEGRACSYGACLEESCELVGCAPGEVCILGACEGDPCAEAACGETQGCRGGECFDTCLGVECPAGQSCEMGLCVDDPCAGRDCAFGAVCEEGVCVDDPCAGVQCPAGEVCDAGMCIDDPCLQTTCPTGTSCWLGECVPNDSAGGQIDTGGGDGQMMDNDGDGDGQEGDDGTSGPPGQEAFCVCATPSAPARWPRAPLVAALLGLIAAVVVRRR